MIASELRVICFLFYIYKNKMAVCDKPRFAT